MSGSSLPTLYGRLKRLAAENVAGLNVAELLFEITDRSLLLLTAECEQVSLISEVPGKEYVAFKIGTQLSRPVNRASFIPSREEMTRRWTSFNPRGLTAMSVDQATNTIYTLAMSFCAANDVLKSGDKQTPGRYFEILNAHIFANAFAVSPRREIDVLHVDDDPATLPTDYIFDLGAERPKFHVPVKTSTRERVIQVWAHQRVLNGVYGENRYVGMLVVLNETKLDRRTLRVIEICLPEQWKLYQRFIARLERIYYLDPPQAYLGLTGFPQITVKKLGEFFVERAQLIEGQF